MAPPGTAGEEALPAVAAAQSGRVAPASVAGAAVSFGVSRRSGWSGARAAGMRAGARAAGRPGGVDPPFGGPRATLGEPASVPRRCSEAPGARERSRSAPCPRQARAPARHPTRSRTSRRPRAPRVHTRHGHDTKMAAGGTSHRAAGASSPKMGFGDGACTPRDSDALSSRLPSAPAGPPGATLKLGAQVGRVHGVQSQGEPPRGCCSPGNPGFQRTNCPLPRQSTPYLCCSNDSRPLISAALEVGASLIAGDGAGLGFREAEEVAASQRARYVA